MCTYIIMLYFFLVSFFFQFFFRKKIKCSNETDGRNGFSRSGSIGSTPGIMVTPIFFINIVFSNETDSRNRFSRSRSIGSTPGIMVFPAFLMENNDFEHFRIFFEILKNSNFSKIAKELYFDPFLASGSAGIEFSIKSYMGS